MSVVYERTGGFAGIRQRLEIDLSTRQLKVTDRHTGQAARTLTSEEATRLQTLITGAQGQPPPTAGDAGRVSDAFTLQLWLGNQPAPQVTLSTVAVPLGKGEGTPWGQLLSFLDALLTAELERARPAGSPRLLSPEDLEQ